MAFTFRPVLVVVAPIGLTTASKPSSGRPFRVTVMNQTRRCSFLFQAGAHHRRMLATENSTVSFNTHIGQRFVSGISWSPLGCLGSVVSQRDHRIDSSGTPRGDIARRERYERQQAHNAGHSDWIMRADAE